MLFAVAAKKTIREYELITVSVIFSLLVSRAAFPPLKYFLLILIPFYFYVSIAYRKRLVSTFLYTIKFFLFPLLLFAIIIFYYFNSDKLYVIVLKDIANIVLLLSVFYFTAVIIHDKDDLGTLYRYSIQLFIIFAIIVSISGLLDYFEIRFYEHFLGSIFPDVSSYDFKFRDNNFYSLPVIFGFTGILLKLTTKRSASTVILSVCILLLFTIAIFFSGSRRAMILLVLAGLTLLFNLLLFAFNRQPGKTFLMKYSGAYLLTLSILISGTYIFVKYASPSIKYRSLEFIGADNVPLVRERIEKSVFNYRYVFNKDLTYKAVNSAIWSPDFIPGDPDSGWGTGRHKTVYPLAGRFSEIVPPGSKGYLTDKESYTGTIDGISFANTELWRFDNDFEYVIHASVYCYVSEDFSGDGARIFSRGSVSGNTSCNYDLGRKGEWQKLNIDLKAQAETDINIDFFKAGLSLESLTGYVIFACPQVNTEKYSFDPKDPDSGWGSSVHKTVFPLSGKNVAIVPADAKGYMLDHSCNGSWDSVTNSCESYTLIKKLSVESRGTFKASVFCYVSEDFNGNNVLMALGWSSINAGIAAGEVRRDYDFSRKGSWQKLEMVFSCKKGEVPIYLNINKNGVKDFRSLLGSVTFANPECVQVTPEIIKSGLLFTVPGMIEKNAILKRQLIGKLISEDTTYNGFKNELNVKDADKEFASDRISRWKFAQYIFEKEYDLREKITGGGFNFLSWYGYFFLKDKYQIDYPHNPFLSVLLYSGILGLLIYLMFVFDIFRIYASYSKKYAFFFFFFLITFYFSFFSAGSPFDPPVMGFFSLLPFLIHSVEKRSGA